MQLNHLDLQVADVQKSVEFFERFFDFELQSNRASPAIAFLSDGQGFVLVLQRKKDPAQGYPEGFHLGFLVSDEETVIRTRTRLAEGGHTVSEVIRNNRGVMIYCRTGDGFLVEVSVRPARHP
jgi:catechol 2,3-dioxygenase-like lactoylglutathione lyase family enzyme